VSLTAAEALAQLSLRPDDEEAWTALHGHFWAFVMATNYRYLGGRSDLADDASQEVFMRIARYRPFSKIQHAEAFKAYLAATCRNVVRDYLRWHIPRDRVVTSSNSEELLESPSMDAAADADIVAAERLSGLADALEEKERILLHLLIEGYGLEEIAERLNVSYTNAGVRVHRLRVKLRNLMMDNGMDIE
jgi:RNA polymerase sigma factor (sigma-70 family)